MNTDSHRRLGAQMQDGRPPQPERQGDCGIAPMGRPAVASLSSTFPRPDRGGAASATDIRPRVSPKASGRGLSASRQLTLVGMVCLCAALAVKCVQVAMTPEFWDWLTQAAARLIDNLAVQFLLVGTAALFLLSLIAASWERAERRVNRNDSDHGPRAA